ncbi:MAG: ATP-binding protein [Spirochaetota bacterium]
MWIPRDIQKELQELSSSYPVVTITGPRQSGKTTLAKMQFPNYNYCNLEHPEIRAFAKKDPNAFFNRFKCPLIIDEIQRVPELLSFIQVKVDEQNEKGLFILTGSHQFGIGQAVSQTLAGRTALLTLLPLSIKELSQSGFSKSRDEYLFHGFLPRIYKNQLNPLKAYRNYFQTYIERDVRQLTKVKDLLKFETFLRLLAGRIGQVLNLNSLSNDAGVSSTTLKEWLSILEASFIILRIPPYYENFGKRFIKSPKFYFTEPGLVSYLLGIEAENQISRDPLIGSLFENMVVIEAVKSRLNKGLDHNLFFFRDNHGNEVDLLFKKRHKLIPIEIKAAMTFHDTFYKGIKFFQRLTELADKGYIIFAGDLTFENNSISVINFRDTSIIFSDTD